jgi:lipopolysaccharide transport system ATP-binding protein
VTHISVRDVSKLYRLYLKNERSQDLTVRVASALAAPLSNLRRLRSLDEFGREHSESTLYALRNISFDVKAGDVVGVIGRNGAGKSTLLKILSRITRPTSGRVEMRGRLSSLLEVGTGFHPELSGRENIFLNGVIIGMRKAEVRRKLDEIVAFSGVERFLDTPIKRYSSGMKVRLAFAVAAHLEPDILVIDEVLAVGDAEFQQKCLGAMAAFGQRGRTVLFVSHNLAAVQSLCKRGIVLERGHMRFDGAVDSAIENYIETIDAGRQGSLLDDGIESDGFVLKELAVGGDADGGEGMVRAGSPCTIRVAVTGRTDVPSIVVTVWLSGGFGERVLLLSSRLAGASVQGFSERLDCEIRIDQLMLMPGHYHLNVALFTAGGERLAAWEQVQGVEVHPDPAAPPLSLPSVGARGVVYAPASWSANADAS